MCLAGNIDMSVDMAQATGNLLMLIPVLFHCICGATSVQGGDVTVAES